MAASIHGRTSGGRFHSLVDTVGWAARQALDRLKVPKSEQAKFLAML